MGKYGIKSKDGAAGKKAQPQVAEGGQQTMRVSLAREMSLALAVVQERRAIKEQGLQVGNRERISVRK